MNIKKCKIKFLNLSKHHNNEKDCWVIIHGIVYDLTDFLYQHPGGADIILKYSGGDATIAFDEIHPPDIIERMLSPSIIKGKILNYINPLKNKAEKRETMSQELKSDKLFINLYDYEEEAKNKLSKTGWAYYSSGSDDCITMIENELAFKRIWLKPRVLINVKEISTSSKIFNCDCDFPLYITSTALGKLAHPEGEIVITRAAAKRNIIQLIPTLSSISLKDILSAKNNDQIQFFQLYVNQDKKLMKKVIDQAEKGGCKALFITVDAPSLGKRELDLRTKATESSNLQKNSRSSNSTSKNLSSFIDPSFEWKDMAWFKSNTKMKIVLKGIQTFQDALLAIQHELDGIVISNHGGRQIDTGLSAIEILTEIQPKLNEVYIKFPNCKKLEILIDGGIRRGSDIFKAMALGATAVGIGRPILYGMAVDGEDGILHTVDILKDELIMTMRLMGTPSLSDIKSEMVDITNLKWRFNTLIKAAKI